MKCVRLYFILCILRLVFSQLKPVMENAEETDNILNFIWKFDKLIHFNSIITYSENLELEEGSSIRASLQQRLMETFERPVINAGIQMEPLDNFISDRNLAVVLFEGLKDQMLNVLHKTLRKQKLITIILAYKSKDGLPPTVDGIKDIFTWCWNKHFRYVMLMFWHNETYETWTFKVKTTIQIFKIDNSILNRLNHQEYLTYGNIGQYRCLVGVYQSLPDVFVYKSDDQNDLTASNVSLGGQTGIMIAEFLRYANGTMDILELSPDDYFQRTTESIVGERNIDIGANVVFNNSLAPYSPLMVSARYCLILPFERRVSLRKYLRHFPKNTSLLGFILFYSILNAVIKRLTNPRMSFTQLIFRTLQLSMGQPISCRSFRCLRLPEKFIEICTHQFTVLILGMFSSALTMFLTTGLRHPEIVDVDSFLASDLRILVYKNESLELFKSNELPRALIDRVDLVDQVKVYQHFRDLNDNYAYVIEKYKWSLLRYVQERLRQPKLKLAPEKLCGPYRHLRLPFRPELSFVYMLKEFIGKMTETGLAEKWMRMGLRQAQLADTLSQAPYDPPSPKALPLEFFANGFKAYGVGLLLSLVAMLVECGYVYWMKRWNNCNNVIIA